MERTFGCIKKRFKILKVPLLFRDASFIDDIFVTCCVLHNKLLDYDNQFEQGHFRNQVSDSTPTHMRRTVLVNNVRRLLRGTDDYSHVGDVDMNDGVVLQIDSGFERKRQQLAQHLYFLFRHRRLKYSCRQYGVNK